MTVPETKNADFFIVDFDRTLVDSDKLLEVFTEIANTYFDIPREQIEKANEDVKKRGDSFDTAGYVRDHLNDEGRGQEWESLEKKFIHESRALNYLLPGASELLEWLAAHGKRYGILTYGDPLWQHLKLTAAGFNHLRHIVMEKKEKGRLISSWQRRDGSFRIPRELGGGDAGRIILIDDKAVSFADFPGEPSLGYWVLHPAHELPSQRGSVQKNVERHEDLYAVLDTLNS